MGGAVSITSPTSPDSMEIKSILEDKEKFNALFQQMSSYGHVDGHIDISNKISLPELILFVEKGVNPLVSRVCASEPIVLKEAFDFACPGKKKNHDHELTKKQFRKLLPTLMLFTHFWRIFEVADSSIEDRRIFKHEYMAAKHSIEGMEGVVVSQISDEDWLAEFTKLDKNRNGFISFHEFTKYAVKMIISPEFYMDGVHMPDMTVEDVTAGDDGGSDVDQSAASVCGVSDSQSPSMVIAALTANETADIDAAHSSVVVAEGVDSSAVTGLDPELPTPSAAPEVPKAVADNDVDCGGSKIAIASGSEVEPEDSPPEVPIDISLAEPPAPAPSNGSEATDN